VSTDRHWQVTDAISTLERSIADAEAEFAAGELTASERDRLVAKDAARIAELAGELALLEAQTVEEPPADVQPPGRRVWKRNLGILLIGAALVVALIGFTTNRQAGQQITGNAGGNASQRLHDALVQAEQSVASGNSGLALQQFSTILTTHPDNAEALAEAGWLTYQAAVVAKNSALITTGRQLVERSVSVDPGQAAGHLYLAIIKRHFFAPRSEIIAELRAFSAGNPSADLEALAKPVLSAYGLS